ncbi:response regulator transcription factor [Cupriavidus respiraculi]|uniref:response regulator transcription factor n=1 Tax=Cupriavidus respiraculi TaxID=195930 RepID=UPI002D7E46C6|nr:response regulator [Cupriavidus respiraculi]
MNALPTPGPQEQGPSDSLVYIVDDDPSLNDALRELLQSVGIASRGFLCARDFLRQEPVDAPSCLVLDVRLRGTSGLELQAQLARWRPDLPVVVMTAHGDVEMTVRAMKAGARGFLAKPVREQDFLDAVGEALEADRRQRERRRLAAALHARFATLSVREREVMLFAVQGLMNKQIADRLGLSIVTVKIHRSNAMRKMAARTFADLVRMAHELEGGGHAGGIRAPLRSAPAPLAATAY